MFEDTDKPRRHEIESVSSNAEDSSEIAKNLLKKQLKKASTHKITSDSSQTLNDVDFDKLINMVTQAYEEYDSELNQAKQTINFMTQELERANGIIQKKEIENHELAIRAANDGLWDWDCNKDQVYYSTRWKEMLGYSETTPFVTL